MLPMIEEAMRALIKKEEPLAVWEMMRENASMLFSHLKQSYKAEYTAAAPSNLVKICAWDDFRDFSSELPALWREDAAEIQAFKLEQIGAAFATDAEGEQIAVTRIKGIAFPDKASFKSYMRLARQARSNDHRQYGLKKRLFSPQDISSDDTPWHWTLEGHLLLNAMQKFWWENHPISTYFPVACPADISSFEMMAKWQQQLVGKHWADSHFSVLRVASLVPCQTFFPSYALWGMCQTYNYTIDIVQIYSLKEFLLEELCSSLQFIEKIVNMFNLEGYWQWEFTPSLKREENLWLQQALDAVGIEVKPLEELSLKPRNKRPRLRYFIYDGWGRPWPTGAVGLRTVNFSENKEISSVKKSHQQKELEKEALFVIERACFGSIERFAALCIERCAGVLPSWLYSMKINQ